MKNELSKAERTRRFIIETTSPIFNKNGYAGTSMSDLTGATGLTKGSIYGNFDNKEEVAAAAFEFNTFKIRKAVQERMDKAQTYHDKLMVYATVYHSFNLDIFPEGGCPILNTAVDADDTNPRLKAMVQKSINNWIKRIEDLIQEGINAGEFAPQNNIKQKALSIIALIEGGIMLAKALDKPVYLDSVLQTVSRMVTELKA
jgi:TetR/AcrR family transcriptional regulator, transcriptional repressor for nem operon